MCLERHHFLLKDGLQFVGAKSQLIRGEACLLLLEHQFNH